MFAGFQVLVDDLADEVPRWRFTHGVLSGCG
jgi:hypothetical protein